MIAQYGMTRDQTSISIINKAMNPTKNIEVNTGVSSTSWACVKSSSVPLHPAQGSSATSEVSPQRQSDFLKRKALEMTENELRLIASAAIIGESNHPVNGNSTPAASGTPSAL